MLELKNLTVSIGRKKILHNISFDFKKGKTYAIMGPNGSGKSTLAATIMGHPAYELNKKSRLLFNGKTINNDPPHKRSEKGIFLSFQTPLSLSGINIYQLMRYALDGKLDPLEIRKKVQKYAKQLKISEELLSRSLNEGFSGGEKKKLEVIQAAMLDPEIIFFDEVDTGVDVDAMRIIASFINSLKKKGKTIILITHYNRILKHVKPDEVIVMRDGKIIVSGKKNLADQIEKEGYEGV
ncbi:Fe-S cluster assembly ATPase SufC [Candidatus Roizmanbacteria bacterium RIFCSPLOWO2_02_FULL_37_19]|uniref:Fe-S cluster assembly ATPase SufC n=1 Tax=Candidatus Roizmanbacteria bacterium RIFCSPHIGHO2_02_FULL_37_24 TaxID=1802037 RepID=A0A1F7GXD6_9BACT|nr:MAG: Fe-S cluster assembly ATPase SufC [Candidatus Roizmanbacteria bacterium RIFCSPHIGHO2_01_FULL_38_41]OGK23513.1 MAG: Fe-S cluster assembly ATPase SufC [Candidatus Roizmanbacteria bacterium RIFCSPHIGHO2_02_FULL_37_24]OGK33471.1 MAG: Fe-S cluster assembly ATPase SufC [Candidatus Roizmanbacteria bacterium RIFCSPHIGHO2_12_FULL_37_23]OGK45390.1 MAG: Fe-S cluster assembly ATPase SufC [Candidatus Roizmanbacteria bacterium RIFCSPLOWO2_01_FULL_37_57]OGK54049.1 MAG: Fe-S cluster assembly ATPase Suf